MIHEKDCQEDFRRTGEISAGLLLGNPRARSNLDFCAINFVSHSVQVCYRLRNRFMPWSGREHLAPASGSLASRLYRTFATKKFFPPQNSPLCFALIGEATKWPMADDHARARESLSKRWRPMRPIDSITDVAHERRNAGRPTQRECQSTCRPSQSRIPASIL